MAKDYKDGLVRSNFAPISGVTWKEQGPTNQGGRTRAIMVDPNDVTGNTVWAGSVGGGLWKTTNINSATPNWTPANDLAGNLAVTSIAYDPSNTQVMYFTTGEGYNNVDAIKGLGVWKTTNGGGVQRSADGGTSWTKVLGTGLGITGAVSNTAYDVEVAVNGDIYASLNGSIHKSTTAGATFAAAQTVPIRLDGSNWRVPQMIQTTCTRSSRAAMS